MDFDLSAWNQEGLIRFKRKFATEEKAISFLRYENGDAPSQRESQARGLLSQLTNLLLTKQCRLV
jgi:hypothetical protein